MVDMLLSERCIKMLLGIFETFCSFFKDVVSEHGWTCL